MSYANIKISSDEIERLKQATGENTGQKAVHKVLAHYLRLARQRRIISVLQKTGFSDGYDPLKLRHHDR